MLSKGPPTNLFAAATVLKLLDWFFETRKICESLTLKQTCTKENS
jgi:hypothetical protein